MESKISDSCTEACINDDELINQIRILYAKALAQPLVFGYDNARIAGHQFHLTTTALLHLWGETGSSPYGKLSAIEGNYFIPLWKYSDDGKVTEYTKANKGKSGYQRNIDLVMDIKGEDRPLFIELKSYKGREGKSKATLKEISDTVLKSRFGQWNMTATKKKGAADDDVEGKEPSGGLHRQFLLDRIASTNNRLIDNSKVREAAWKAKQIMWRFQDYTQTVVGGLTPSQITTIQNQLAKTEAGVPKVIKASLGIGKDVNYSYSEGQKVAKASIALFNFKEVLKDSGSQLTRTLFDEAQLSEQLEEQINTLIFGELP